MARAPLPIERYITHFGPLNVQKPRCLDNPIFFDEPWLMKRVRDCHLWLGGRANDAIKHMTAAYPSYAGFSILRSSPEFVFYFSNEAEAEDFRERWG